MLKRLDGAIELSKLNAHAAQRGGAMEHRRSSRRGKGSPGFDLFSLSAQPRRVLQNAPRVHSRFHSV